MSEPIIKVENLSKKYIIGHQVQGGSIVGGFPTLRDRITDGANWLKRQLVSTISGQKIPEPTSEEFWALKDVSFEIQRGDCIGIIGRNGAGKSTLLKILSRITEPTTGQITINGRVASLLEVGTGFHPELTGRENVYLNGAILGMSKIEIKNKFDEIVEFAEIEKFLDTPVKRYSSGMYVRLAFAVAAHLEPEILIVDEVLAVGDAAFQRKCLGKMDDVAKQGRTVVFVSHNMGVMQTLCKRGILLQQGTVIADGTASATVTTYLEILEKAASQNLLERTERGGNGRVRLAHMEITTGESFRVTNLATGRPARFIFHTTGILPRMSCCFTIYDQLGQPVTFFDSAMSSQEDLINPENGAKFVCEIDELLLIPGRYRINAALMCDGEYEDDVKSVTFFEVEEGKIRDRPVLTEHGYGSILIQHRWSTPV